MKIAVLGGTNIEKQSIYLDKSKPDIEDIFERAGLELGRRHMIAVTVFNLLGSLKTVSESCVRNGGKHEILFTKNNYDWDVGQYLSKLPEAAKFATTIEKASWHDMLLSLVSDYEYILVCGISLGVMVELGYIKWNIQDKKGRLKKIIFVEELLRHGELPSEISLTFDDKLFSVVSINELGKHLDGINE